MMEKQKNGPSEFSTRIIKLLIKESLQEEMLGNLEEFYFLEKKSTKGIIFQWKFWVQLLSYIRISNLKAPKSYLGSGFHFSLKLIFRHMWLKRTTTIMNISGLCIGIISVLILFIYVDGEFAYDSFHEDKESTFRLIRKMTKNGQDYDVGVTSGPYARALKMDFGDMISETMRVGPYEALVRFGDKVFNEERLIAADPNFFLFFSYPIIAGNKESVLTDIGSVVISEEMAKKYFADANPIGETLNLDNETDFIVTGIFVPGPEKSHLDFDFVTSLEFYEDRSWMQDWWSNWLCTYIKLNIPSDEDKLADMLPAFMERNFAERVEQSGGIPDLKLEKLKDIYLNENTTFDNVLHGNKTSLFILIMVGIGILIIACFNYMNLTLAGAFRRVKEISVRKILGGGKNRIFNQIIGESLFLVVFALAISLLLTDLTIPFFNELFGTAIVLNWQNPDLWIFVVFIVVFVVLSSGIVPAAFLSALQPVKAFKGNIFSMGRKPGIKSTLVLVQFSIATFMLLSTLMIYSQMVFINDKDLGFKMDQIMIIDVNNSSVESKIDLIKNKLEQLPEVLAVSSMSGEPGGFHDGTILQTDLSTDNRQTRTVFADYDYINVFGMEIVAGRNFSKDIRSDFGTTAIVNKRAAAEFGYELNEIIGQRVFLPMFDTLKRTVIGVVDDFNFSSLKEKIEPLIICLDQQPRTIVVKLNGQNLRGSIHVVHQIWDELLPEFPFSYRLMNDKWNDLYADEHQQNRIFIAFSIISVFLSCLGILGLVSYSVTQRQKEFGIKKVLGAGVRKILFEVSKSYVTLISFSFLVSIPLSVWFIKNWLDSFEYRIDIIDYWYHFLLTSVVVLVIALLTISARTIKTAMANPVHALRQE